MVFIYIILGFIFIISFLVLFSSIEVHIKNVKYLSENKNLNKDYKIEIKLRLFEKITYLKINLRKNNMKKITKMLNINKLKEKILENKNNFDIGILKMTTYWKIKKLDLKIDVGTKDAAINAIIVGVLSSIIAITLRNFIEEKSKAFWRVKPIYKNKNLLKVNIDAILRIRLIDIISRKKVFS